MIRTRLLTRDEVVSINSLLKARSRRFLAAYECEWVFPERESTVGWEDIGKVLLPPSLMSGRRCATLISATGKSRRRSRESGNPSLPPWGHLSGCKSQRWPSQRCTISLPASDLLRNRAMHPCARTGRSRPRAAPHQRIRLLSITPCSASLPPHRLAARRVESDLEARVIGQGRGQLPAHAVLAHRVRQPEPDIGRAREAVTEERHAAAHLRVEPARRDHLAVRSQSRGGRQFPQPIRAARVHAPGRCERRRETPAPWRLPTPAGAVPTRPIRRSRPRYARQDHAPEAPCPNPATGPRRRDRRRTRVPSQSPRRPRHGARHAAGHDRAL